MWETVADDVGAVLAWARDLAADGLTAKEVYVSDDDARVVVVTHWSGEPPETLRAGGRAWRFRRVL